MENIYKAKRNEARFTVDTVSPNISPSYVTLITILGIWPIIGRKSTIDFDGPEGI